MTSGLPIRNNGILVNLTCYIVGAYVKNNFVPISELSGLIVSVHSALGDTWNSAAMVTTVVEKQKPAISVRRSVRDDHITCLECGGDYKSMKRHLMTHHGQSPEGYREKWNLPADYPMVAPSYAEARSQLAKTMGLGQKGRLARSMR